MTSASADKLRFTKDFLTVAQVGCGAFAAGQDLPNFQKHPHTRVKWCCDTDEQQARSLAKAFDIPCVTADLNDVVSDPEVDLIKIATSHEAHLPIVEAAAANGKHIFCEKPMALEEKEAFAIISAVRRGGVKLCVDLNRRMAPSLHALRQNWQQHLVAPRHQPWRYVEIERELFPEEEQTQFLIRIQDESYSYRLIHLDPQHGGGLLIGESVHWFDLACWFFAPQIPVEIQAWGSARFSHGAHVTFSSGDTATLIFNCGGSFDYPKELYEVTSHGALFRNRFFVENEYHGIPGLDRETFPLQHDDLPEIGAEGGFSGYTQKYRTRVQGLAGNSKEGHGELMVDKGHENMLATFVDAILHDKPSPCDELAGYLSVYLARLAIQSIEQRQALPVPVDRVHPCIV
ncbi:MAG: Gfo/Idh/MocA family oxidoreductase [Gemmatimonadetes bacterium]|jgi:predicted dehydrogenase|nr:Gfo/Idh/MocA family oxidoreductase [Gemmatimonadota bacterium]